MCTSSQSIETKEDLLFGIPSRKQPLLFSAYEQCHDKIYYSSRCFHLRHLCSSDLSSVNSFCFSNSSIISKSIISSSNVLSSLSRTRDTFFSRLGEKHFSYCKISAQLRVSPCNFSLSERKRFYFMNSSRHTLGYYFTFLKALLSAY